MRNKIGKLLILVGILILGSIMIYNIFGTGNKSSKIDYDAVSNVTYGGCTIPIAKDIVYTVRDDRLELRTNKYVIELGFDYSNKYNDYKNDGFNTVKVDDKDYLVKTQKIDTKEAKQFVMQFDKKSLVIGTIAKKGYKEITKEDLQYINTILSKTKRKYEVDKKNIIENVGLNGLKKYTFDVKVYNFD